MARKLLSSAWAAVQFVTTDHGNPDIGDAPQQVTARSAGDDWVDLNGRYIMGNGSSPTGDQLAHAQWVSDQIALAGITGSVMAETLLSVVQLADNAQGLRPAFGIYFNAQPAAGAVFALLSDTHAAETFTEGVDWLRGANAASAMTALAAAINAGTNFAASYEADLDQFQATNGMIVVVTKTTPSAADDFRAYCDDTTNTRIVSFNSTTATGAGGTASSDYTFDNKKGVFAPSATDPGANVDYSGPLRQASSITTPKTHYVQSTDAWYTWNADSAVWFLSNTNSVPTATGASGGGTKGKASYDTDKGLAVASGVVSLNLETAGSGTGGLRFVSGALGLDLGATPGLVLAADGVSALGGDGITVDANGIKIDLATNSGLTLDNTNGTGKLLIDLDTDPGLELGAGGVKVARDDSSIKKVTATGVLQVGYDILGEIEESLTLDATAITNKYIDGLAQVPADITKVQMYVIKSNGVSPPQLVTEEFSIVHNGSGAYKRVTWDPSYSGTTGTAPSSGLVSYLASGDKLRFVYFYKVHTAAA